MRASGYRYDRRRLRQWLAGEARADGVTRRRLLTLLTATTQATVFQPVTSENLPGQPSLLSSFAETGPTAKVVLGILLFFSLVSWAIIFAKWIRLRPVTSLAGAKNGGDDACLQVDLSNDVILCVCNIQGIAPPREAFRSAESRRARRPAITRIALFSRARDVVNP